MSKSQKIKKQLGNVRYSLMWLHTLTHRLRPGGWLVLSIDHTPAILYYPTNKTEEKVVTKYRFKIFGSHSGNSLKRSTVSLKYARRYLRAPNIIADPTRQQTAYWLRKNYPSIDLGKKEEFLEMISQIEHYEST